MDISEISQRLSDIRATFAEADARVTAQINIASANYHNDGEPYFDAFIAAHLSSNRCEMLMHRTMLPLGALPACLAEMSELAAAALKTQQNLDECLGFPGVIPSLMQAAE